jgi:uncharacterized Zn finger protein
MSTLHCPSCGNANDYESHGSQPIRGTMLCTRCGAYWDLTWWTKRGVELRLRVPGILNEGLTGGGSTKKHTP